MSSENTSLSRLHNPEDNDYPFVYTVRAGISREALKRASILLEEKKTSKRSFSHVLSLNSSCVHHLPGRLVFGPLDDIREDCKEFLDWTPQSGTERPQTVFQIVNEAFQIPQTQQWWLWGVTKAVPAQKDAVLLQHCEDILHYIDDFYARAEACPNDKSRWVMHLVVELARDQPKLLTPPSVFTALPVRQKEPEPVPFVDLRSPKRNGRDRPRARPADEGRNTTREPRRRNSEWRRKDFPEPKTFQRKREERQHARETSAKPVRRESQARTARQTGTSREKESSGHLPPRKVPVTRREKSVPRVPSPPPFSLSPSPSPPSSPCLTPSPSPTPSPPPIEPLIPQDSLNDDRICAPGSLLRHMDTSSKPGNVTHLIPLAGSPSERQWAECCELLALDPEQHRDSSARSIHIPGSRVWATPRQYRTAIRMLRQQTHHNMAGGYLADEPGTGKTYTIMVYILLRTLIFHSKYEVETTSPQSHRVSGNRCSCRNAVGVQCYAIRDGITRNLIKNGLVSGPALLQTEPTVLESWSAAFCEAKLSSTYYHPVLFSATLSSTPRELAQPGDLIKKMGCNAKTDSSTVREHKEKRVTEIPIESCSFSFNKRRGSDRPLERYIFLATYTAAPFKRVFQIPVLCKDKPTGLTVYCCPIGVHIIDEHHKESGLQSNSMKMVFSHKRLYAKLHPEEKNDFSFWAVSGTPFPSESLSNIRAFLKALERPDWSSPRHKHHVRRPQVLSDLETQRSMAATGGPVDCLAFEMRLKEFLGEAEETLFIRHMNPNAVRPTRVSFVTAPFHPSMQTISFSAYKNLREYIDSDVSRLAWTPQRASATGEGFNTLRTLRMLSSFPALALVLVDAHSQAADMLRCCDDPDYVKDNVLAAMEHRDATEISPVAEFWRMVTLESPKLEFVLRLLDVMDRDKTMREPEPESESDSQSSRSWCGYVPAIDLSIKKLVVITGDILESVLYYVALRSKRPDCKPLLLHGRMSSKARKAVLKEWDSLKKSSSCILVTTFDASGTGINLQVANYQVLTSPLRTVSQEEQCFGRTNRAGQRLPLHQYLLLSEDNPYDRLMVANQAGIQLLDPFNISGNCAMEIEDFQSDW